MVKYKNFNLGIAFDASHVRGKCANYQKDLDFNNLETTLHTEHLESDYKYFYEKGVRLFRDGSLMYRTCPSPLAYDWSYLDRVASQKGDIQISLSHYEFPSWMSREDIFYGRFSDFLSDFTFKVCQRYGNRFHSIIPAVEIGYWCHMISSWNRWYPFIENWWAIYDEVMRATIESAKILRSFNVDVALSEPFGFEMLMEDQARPFLNLLGFEDKIAEENGIYFKGDYDLLQIAGCNFYRLDTVKSSIEELKALLPDKEIVIAETGNCHNQHISPDEWLSSLDNLGKIVDNVIWSPAIEMSNFEFGEDTGGYLLDKSRTEFLLQYENR